MTDPVMLIAASVVSAMVGALVTAVRRRGGPAARRNDPDARLAPEEHWRLVVEELALEATTSGMLNAVAARLRDGDRFSMWERLQLLSMMPDERARRSLRRLFSCAEANRG